MVAKRDLWDGSSQHLRSSSEDVCFGVMCPSVVPGAVAFGKVQRFFEHGVASACFEGACCPWTAVQKSVTNFSNTPTLCSKQC